MKKIAFVFVAAIVASVAVSMSSCKKGEAKDSVKADTVDTAAVEAPAACCDSAAAVDSAVVADSAVVDSAAAPAA